VHVRRNDQIIVIRGEHAGKRGKVLRVDTARSRVLVEGVNFVLKHVRRSPEAPQGGRLEREAPLSASNVAVFCATCGRGVRVRRDGAGTRKIRRCHKCNNPVGATK